LLNHHIISDKLEFMLHAAVLHIFTTVLLFDSVLVFVLSYALYGNAYLTLCYY